MLATLTIYWITRSRFGFGLIAIRENEEGAAVMGVNTILYKTLAFALSGIFSALAGGIHAYWVTFIDPESAFDIGLNVKMIIMAVFGGPGTILGPVVGAFSLSAVSEFLSSEITSLAGLFFGVVVVAAVVLMPRGNSPTCCGVSVVWDGVTSPRIFGATGCDGDTGNQPRDPAL